MDYTYIKYAAKNKKETSIYMWEFQNDNEQEILEQNPLNRFH